MASDLPIADPGAPWMIHLERAHALIHQAAIIIEEQIEPSEHLAPAARQLEQRFDKALRGR